VANTTTDGGGRELALLFEEWWLDGLVVSFCCPEPPFIVARGAFFPLVYYMSPSSGAKESFAFTRLPSIIASFSCITVTGCLQLLLPFPVA